MGDIQQGFEQVGKTFGGYTVSQSLQNMPMIFCMSCFIFHLELFVLIVRYDSFTIGPLAA